MKNNTAAWPNWVRNTRSWIGVFWAAIALGGWLFSVYGVKPVFVGDCAVKVGAVGVHPVIENRKTDNYSEMIYQTPIEETTELAEILRAKYRVPEAKKRLTGMPHLFFIEERSGGVLRLRARGHTAEEVKDFLNGLLEWVERRHRLIFQESTGRISDRNKDLQRAIARHLFETYNARATSELLESEVDGSEKQAVNLATLVKALMEVDFAQSRIRTKETIVILDPTIHETPTRPKPLVYFLVALVVAIIGYIHTIGLLILWESQSAKAL